jgi:hypothetical protein
MRRECQPIDNDAETVAYTFHFQISDRGARQACSVKVQATNFSDATAFFRQNWPMIETMARDRLANKCSDDRSIKLAVPWRPEHRG